MSYDLNEQVHLTFDLWEKHIVGVFMLEFLIFFGTCMFHVQNKHLTGQYFI